MVVITYAIVVVLPPNETADDAISCGFLVVFKMKDNPRFPNPPIPLANVQGQIAALQADHIQVKTGVHGAAAERSGSLRALRTSLRRLREYVQSIAETDPANALAIAQSAGMKLKQRSSRQKAELSADWGELTGQIVLLAKAGEGTVTYDWQMSTDEKVWTKLESTGHCTTTVDNLTPGTLYYFCVRVRGTKGRRKWSDAISIIAH